MTVSRCGNDRGMRRPRAGTAENDNGGRPRRLIPFGRHNVTHGYAL